MPGLDGMLKASQAGRSDSWGGGEVIPQQKMPVEDILIHCSTQPWGNGPKRPGGQGMDSDSTDNHPKLPGQ